MAVVSGFASYSCKPMLQSHRPCIYGGGGALLSLHWGRAFSSRVAQIRRVMLFFEWGVVICDPI